MLKLPSCILGVITLCTEHDTWYSYIILLLFLLWLSKHGNHHGKVPAPKRFPRRRGVARRTNGADKQITENKNKKKYSIPHSFCHSKNKSYTYPIRLLIGIPKTIYIQLPSQILSTIKKKYSYNPPRRLYKNTCLCRCLPKFNTFQDSTIRILIQKYIQSAKKKTFHPIQAYSRFKYAKNLCIPYISPHLTQTNHTNQTLHPNHHT
jgi:hypothetical protein